MVSEGSASLTDASEPCVQISPHTAPQSNGPGHRYLGMFCCLSSIQFRRFLIVAMPMEDLQVHESVISAEPRWYEMVEV
jgi:hypothetical protein